MIDTINSLQSIANIYCIYIAIEKNNYKKIVYQKTKPFQKPFIFKKGFPCAFFKIFLNENMVTKFKNILFLLNYKLDAF
jgi:hypothetical protein